MNQTGLIVNFGYGALGWGPKISSFEQLINFCNLLESLALYDECFVFDYLGTDNKTMFGPKNMYADALHHWLNDFGFNENPNDKILKGIGYKWDVKKYISIKEFLEDRIELGLSAYSNDLAHCILESDFAYQNQLSYLPSPEISQNLFQTSIKLLGNEFENVFFAAYKELNKSIQEDLKLLYSEGRRIDLKIPPFALLILSRASKKSNIYNELLSIRDEIAIARNKLNEYQSIIVSPDSTIKDAIDARKSLVSTFMDLSSQYGSNNISLIEWKDLLSLSDNIIDGISAEDFKSSSLLKVLLDKPLKKISQNYKRRKMAIFFKAKDNYYKSSIMKEVNRLFGNDIK